MRLSVAERGALEALRGALEARFGRRLDRLVLFGSRARGEGHEDSDLDVLVLIEDAGPADRRGALDIAWEIERARGIALSPLVRDPRRWRPPLSLARELARDGRSVGEARR
jgi:predicted nucleotidyltransferase